jgi:hypothetical protein
VRWIPKATPPPVSFTLHNRLGQFLQPTDAGVGITSSGPVMPAQTWEECDLPREHLDHLTPLAMDVKSSSRVHPW